MSGEGRGCGYEGFEFGGGYLDAVCGVDGWLWDPDSGDGDGLLYHDGEDAGVPCPKCRPEEYRGWSGCPESERERRIARAFGPTPWIPSEGPKRRKERT